MQTLGEYQTTVTRIRLVDKAADSVVWELKARSGTPQLNKIELKVGLNPSVLAGVSSGAYTVVTPIGPSFSLAPGREYRVDLWAKDNDARRVSGTFRLRGD